MNSRFNFFNGGVIIAFLRDIGMSPNVNDKFIILVNQGSTSSMHSLNNHEGNGSRMQNVCGNKKTKSFTSFSVNVQNSFKADLNFSISRVSLLL